MHIYDRLRMFDRHNNPRGWFLVVILIAVFTYGVVVGRAIEYAQISLAMEEAEEWRLRYIACLESRAARR